MKSVRLLAIFIFLIFLACDISNAQTWQKSFSAGNYDLNGQYLGGSEVMQLVSHKKKLYASIGYWEDATNIWYGGSNSNIGWGQIIRLDNSNGNWQEDFKFGASYLRPEILDQLIFTKDTQGNLLTSPDTLLIAAAYSPNYITSIVSARAFVRNDNNGTWEESLICQGGLPAGENYSIRDIQVYTDQITGIEQIYVSVGVQGIFTGTYNPNITGNINWNTTPEIGPLSIRSLGITQANNALYFSSGNKLYKRDDGINSSYSVIHDFSDLSTNINSAVGGIRGLTTISNPNGNNEALLLMWCPDSQSKGTIYRLEPNGNGGFDRYYETKISLLVENYLAGSSVSYLLGAYNEFYEYTDLLTNNTYHIIGFESSISAGAHPTWNGYYSGALFAKRDNNMQYTLEEVNGTIGMNDTALVAIRCYVKSPFNSDESIYFGGFDPNGNISTNMAWIYKKTYQNTSVSELPTIKEILRVIDILGRQTKETKNTLLFYIYNDGTVEKKIIIE
jgi:hypothetical protein